MYWEVWSDAEPKRLCGLLYLSDIVPGCEAMTHYVFFDGHLRDKTPLLLAMLDWAFSDHPELAWRGLHRLTVEVPTTHTALAAHAQKRLGFVAEGTKREVIRQRGKWLDTLILGRIKNG